MNYNGGVDDSEKENMDDTFLHVDGRSPFRPSGSCCGNYHGNQRKRFT
jgi:hypothetical protein